jgi:hypothetical protein
MNEKDIRRLLEQLRDHRAAKGYNIKKKKHEDEEPIEEDSFEESFEVDTGFETESADSIQEEEYEEEQEQEEEEDFRSNQKDADGMIVPDDAEEGTLQEQYTFDEDNDSELFARIKELKAKKLVNEYERAQHLQKVDDLRKIYKQRLKDANDLFEQWILLRNENFHYIQQVTTEELTIKQQELDEDTGRKDRTALLWQQLCDTREAFFKLKKFVELKQAEHDSLQNGEAVIGDSHPREELREGTEELNKKLEDKKKKREECEKRTESHRQEIVRLREEIEAKKKKTRATQKKIDKVEIMTARELQFLAKKLFK